MDYKQAYNKLITAVIQDETVSSETIKKAQEINSSIEENKSKTNYEKNKDKQTLKNEILAIKDTTERQQAIKEHMDLFN